MVTSSLLNRYLKPSVGNAVGILGVILALAFGVFSAVTSYLDMKWSEHADAVQTCISLYVSQFLSGALWS